MIRVLRRNLSLEGAIVRLQNEVSNEQALIAASDDWDTNWDKWDDIDEGTSLDLPWPNDGSV